MTVIKRLLLVALIGTALAAPIHDEFREKVVKFHQAYDVFLRKYIGCPIDKKPPEHEGYQRVDCDAMLGTVDQQAWHRAREAAKELFDLKEKNEQ